jgi:hypothetical protein
MNQQALLDYAKAGGRVFASHFHYSWFNTGPFASANLATWTPGANNMGDIRATGLADALQNCRENIWVIGGECFFRQRLGKGQAPLIDRNADRQRCELRIERLYVARSQTRTVAASDVYQDDFAQGAPPQWKKTAF